MWNSLRDHGEIILCLVVENVCTVIDLYSYPVASSRLAIFEVCALSGHLDIALARDFSNKYVLLPHGNRYAAFPLQ